MANLLLHGSAVALNDRITDTGFGNARIHAGPSQQHLANALRHAYWSYQRLVLLVAGRRVPAARSAIEQLYADGWPVLQTIKALEREIAGLVATIAPQLLSEPGFGPLTAAKLVGEIAGAQRFATAAKPARAAGVAPIPASSGNTRRQRLDQGGNRQINAALHRVIVTRARCHPATQDYIARRCSEGKTTREAIRCLKRYLARHVWRLLQPPHPDKEHRHHHQSLDIEATEAEAEAPLAGASGSSARIRRVG